jgi:7-carboxy-7-deazaguanine synthase
MNNLSTLRITEIFFSLQGEAVTSGLPTVFIRLTGCPLRCSYCDTEYAFHNGLKQTIEFIISQVNTYNTPYVTVTGGEPLAQKNVHCLLSELCDQGKYVSLETSGALEINDVDTRVNIVMDLKTPSSQESMRNKYENISKLKKGDQIKFVIGSREDYEWSKSTINHYHLSELGVELLFSSANEVSNFSSSPPVMNPAVLAQWIIDDQLLVRFQMQLHKVLWHDEQGR